MMTRASCRAGAAEYNYDIEQRNSHLTIVAHLNEVREHLTLYPSLIRYGKGSRDEREATLGVVMTNWQCSRSAAKQLINSLSNTGTIRGW